MSTLKLFTSSNLHYDMLHYGSHLNLKNGGLGVRNFKLFYNLSKLAKGYLWFNCRINRLNFILLLLDKNQSINYT